MSQGSSISSNGPTVRGEPPLADPVEEMMKADSASQALGMEVIEHGNGRARVRMLVRSDMVNGHDVAHGGLIFALADTAFACACNSIAPPSLAAAAEIAFVAPARLGEVLVAEAVMRTRFGRNGIYDVTVRCGDQVIAEFRGRSYQIVKSS